MSELQGLQLQHDAFAARDAAVLAVVVDPVDTNATLARDLGLSYHILADPELVAIDAYGVRHEDGGPSGTIARPATFLIDAEGVVRWRNLVDNYRYRPRPETIVAELDRLPSQ